MADLKWKSSWGEVVHQAPDRQTCAPSLARRAGLAAAAAVAVAVVLVVVSPPLACAPASGVRAPQLSAPRVACWAVLGALAAAVLGASDVFKRRSAYEAP